MNPIYLWQPTAHKPWQRQCAGVCISSLALLLAACSHPSAAAPTAPVGLDPVQVGVVTVQAQPLEVTTDLPDAPAPT